MAYAIACSNRSFDKSVFFLLREVLYQFTDSEGLEELVGLSGRSDSPSSSLLITTAAEKGFRKLLRNIGFSFWNFSRVLGFSCTVVEVGSLLYSELVQGSDPPKADVSSVPLGTRLVWKE